MAQKALKFMKKGDIIDGSERSEQDRSSTAVVEIKESKKNEKSEIQAYTEEYERSESSSPGVEVNKAEWSSCEKLQKKKRNRTTFTTFQLDSLEIFFAKNGYPGHDAIKKLSQSIQLNKQKIMVSRNFVSQQKLSLIDFNRDFLISVSPRRSPFLNGSKRDLALIS